MKKLISVFVFIIWVTGCSQAATLSQDEIKEIVINYASAHYILWSQNGLPIDEVKSIGSVEIKERGNYNKQENYYPIRLSVTGTRLRGISSGTLEPFDVFIDAQFMKNDYGEWQMHIKKSIELTADTTKNKDDIADDFFKKGMDSSSHDEQIDYFSKAIKIKPDYSSYYFNRSMVYIITKQYKKGEADLLKCVELEPVGRNQRTLSMLASLYATANDPNILDGKKAIAYGLKASSIPSDYLFVNIAVTDALAAAYARDGQFDNAVETQQKAVDMAMRDKKYTTEKTKAIRLKKLNLYKERKPYTEIEP